MILGVGQPFAERFDSETEGEPVYKVDWVTSQQRAEDLESYLTNWVAKTTVGRMVCASYADCQASAGRAAFYEAQGDAVGSCYDLTTVNGVPLRVLIVPIDAGGRGKYASVTVRTGHVRASGRLRFTDRNGHMGGVTLALRLALGLPYQKSNGEHFIDPCEEQVKFTDGTHAHLFECFAMANMTLCAAVTKKGGQHSCQTQVMRDNCTTHLQNTIDILQPTLVISQGRELVDTLRTCSSRCAPRGPGRGLPGA